MVGVSNPHPHGQIYATNFVFKTIETEAAASRRYYQEHGRVLFQDIIRSELDDGRRMLFENSSAIVFLPYFARYAYECYVAPKETHASLATMSAGERHDLAAALKSLLVRYDNLWQMSFPYVLTLHQAPTDGGDYCGFHFHIECHPPLRKPHLLKYLAGPEIGGGNFLSDTTARSEGGGAARGAPTFTTEGVPACVTRARCSNRCSRCTHDVRDEVVAATERHSVESTGGDRSRRAGRHDLRDRRRRRSDRHASSPETLAREHSFVLVAEGLPGGRRCYPDGARRGVRRLAGSSSTRSTARAA